MFTGLRIISWHLLTSTGHFLVRETQTQDTTNHWNLFCPASTRYPLECFCRPHKRTPDFSQYAPQPKLCLEPQWSPHSVSADCPERQSSLDRGLLWQGSPRIKGIPQSGASDYLCSPTTLQAPSRCSPILPSTVILECSRMQGEAIRPAAYGTLSRLQQSASAPLQPLQTRRMLELYWERYKCWYLAFGREQILDKEFYYGG